MKHQYFGDINDYRKYGLLRALSEASGLPLGVCWLLTPDDERPDGEFRDYLTQPERWRQHDPSLYDTLQQLSDPSVPRSVGHAKPWDLIPGATYYPAILRDSIEERSQFFKQAWAELAQCPLLFFDPDNGLEVASTPAGRKKSSKYLYWSEVQESYVRGHSLVVYQHFPRRERTAFMRELVEEASARLGATSIDTFATSHVLFLLIPRPEHTGAFERAHDLIRSRWGGQITPRGHVQ